MRHWYWFFYFGWITHTIAALFENVLIMLLIYVIGMIAFWSVYKGVISFWSWKPKGEVKK